MRGYGRRTVALCLGIGLATLVATSSAGAAVRFAEPNGDGPSGVGGCPQDNPCSLDLAVEDPVVADGDEVVILPGDYNLADALLVNDGIELHGADGLPRPRLIGSSSPVVNAFDPLLHLRDFDITRTGTASGTALGLGGGTAERLFVQTGANAAACSLSGGALIRDSVCWGGVIGVGFNQSSGSTTGSLRNVTVVGTDFGISVFGSVGHITYNAKNVIASGAVDIRAEGDASGSATVNLDHSNYDTEVEDDNGGDGDASITDPGSPSNQLAAPVLADAANGDFHQLEGSPTIDAGTRDPLLGAFDFDGETRAHGTAPDIGADEFAPPGPDPELGPEPQPKADGTLTIDANKGKVEKGRKVTLTGQLDVASNESCEPNRQIQIQRRLKSQDDSKFATFKAVQTDATGNYSLRVKVKKTYFYRAVVSETDACDDETSNSQKVRVQTKKAAQEA
jgi:hypothetical protein